MNDKDLLRQALDAFESVFEGEDKGLQYWTVKGGTYEAVKCMQVMRAIRHRLLQEDEPDWSAAGFTKPPKRSEEWWKHEVSNAWAEGYLKGQASVKNLLEEYEQTFVDAFVQKLNSK